MLYSGGFPAATISHPSGSRWFPKVLHWRNCSIIGASVSLTQLISSRNRIPSRTPVFSISWYTEARISLIVYSVTEYASPP